MPKAQPSGPCIPNSAVRRWRTARRLSLAFQRLQRESRSAGPPKPGHSLLLRDLAKNAQQVATEELLDALFRVAAPQHGVGDQREIAHVAHPAGERRAAVKV